MIGYVKLIWENRGGIVKNMLNIDEYIQPYREKLKGIYEIHIAYNQKNNSFQSHWNYIRINLKSGFRDYDFFHEYTHLRFLTEEGAIKYPYPIEKHYDEQNFFALGSNLSNIVYDIYVDAFISQYYNVPREYFKFKIKEFEKFLNSSKDIIPNNITFDNLIKKAIKDYLTVLRSIANNDVYHLNYVKNNSIVSQREQINQYLNEEGLKSEFEWITYHTLYIRECVKTT